MTGFSGQKFNFTGQGEGGYVVLSNPPQHPPQHAQKRTRPVGARAHLHSWNLHQTTDTESVDHTIVTSVANPHSLDSSCPVGVSPCLAEGTLSVELDLKPALVAPGEVSLGPALAISAVNFPGARRCFGFEKYSERKKADYAGAGRWLWDFEVMQDMAEWVLGYPTATTMDECIEYMTGVRAPVNDDARLFAHDSEHASNLIMTPVRRIRLSHGCLHQLAVRDPTDLFDVPDHITWQTNLAVDYNGVSLDVTGILREALVPALDGSGNPITEGMESIRGSKEDCKYQVQHRAWSECLQVRSAFKKLRHRNTWAPWK